MKIGILTFHCAHNYGAVLQAYGLQEYLKSLGHEVYIIDYRPKYLVNNYKPFQLHYWLSKKPFKAINRLFNEPFLCRMRRLRYKKFNIFIQKNLVLSPYHCEDNFSNFDILFLGSDQIWNSHITGYSFDSIYWGKNVQCKVISYAASMGRDSLTVNEKQYIHDQLKNFSSIAVREDSLQKLLQPLTDKKVHVVLDPTLLSGIDVFSKIAVKPSINSPYILVYQIERHSKVIDIANRIASQLNAKVIELVSSVIKSKDSKKDQTASPEEFVGYFSNAICVVTTSFHGTAFSLMFNRPFYSIRQNTKADLRLISLLGNVGLMNRFINMDDNPVYSEIDYSEVNRNLSKEVHLSCDFITNSLKHE